MNAPCKVQAPYCLLHTEPKVRDGSGEWHCPSCRVTAKQLEILQHSLGVDQYGRGQQYRNHFCAGGDDEKTCRELVAKGYMVQHQTTETMPYFNCSVTDAGKKAMRDQSPAPPQLTAGQKRYQKFLAEDSDMTFGEWLKGRKQREEYRSSVPARSMRGDFAYDQVAADRYAMERKR